MFTTFDKLRAVMHGKGYRFFETGQYNLNIVGVRSETSKSNDFDDRLLVAFKDNQFQTVVKEYAITTDPGKPWLLKPLDAGGTAIIVPGQYTSVYKIGIHGRSKPAARRYEALEQIGKMRYVRDNNRDSIIDTALCADPSKCFEAILKTNIHRASRWAITRLVETYSAGCQVFSDPKEFDEFMETCRTSRELNHTTFFTYTLLMENDFK